MGGLHNSVLKVADPGGFQRKGMSKFSSKVLGVDDGGHGDPLLLTKDAQNYNKGKKTEAAEKRVNQFSFIHNKSVTDRTSAHRYKSSGLKIGK